MALGKRSDEQQEMWVATTSLPKSQGHVFYRKLNQLLAETVAVDSTTLEANAAMKSIVRRDSGEDWKEYLRRLLQEQEGVENPTDEELRRFDRKRKDKRVSNEEWMSPTDPESRIGKMKDGRTHLLYKAEHVVDLGSEVVLAVPIYHGDEADGIKHRTCSRTAA